MPTPITTMANVKNRTDKGHKLRDQGDHKPILNKGIKGKKDSKSGSFNLTDYDLIWWSVFVAIISLTAGTRLYKISEPDHVCWDETHFGKMGSWYINRTFFFDVHPPLGKMLIGLSGHLTGYNGTFPFIKPGDKYGDTPYLGMRLFCVLLGSSVVPFTFLITYEMTQSLATSILSSSFLLFDVGFITLSQYILLDPILLFFISGAFLGSVKVIYSQHHHPFRWEWWFWMVWTGFFLAGAVSVKFVGFFIVTVVGLQTVADLWIILGDLKVSMFQFVQHFLARTLCLILLPITLYLAIFYVHLSVLNKSGSGDGFFSSAFQSQLEGNSLFNASMPEHIAFGSMISLKNVKTGGGYLHSHWHLYPEGVGARQQQVTGYSHKDDNNKWIIKKHDVEPNVETDPIELVKDGDLVRFEHAVTNRNIHSHRELAPVTKRHFQVTCYGQNGTGDANDVWRLQMIDRSLALKDKRIKVVTTSFRLIHYFVGCALSCNTKQLPKWGFEQMEVTCNPNVKDKSTIWNIEDNTFDRLPNVSFNMFAPSFLQKVAESHAVMFQGNSGLKPKEGEVTSRPWQWPINYRGQFFSGNDVKIYLLGNPVIWWCNILCLILYLLMGSFLLVKDQRESDAKNMKKYHTLTQGGLWLFVSWAVHYVPFYGMGRVLYYHHYFPASIFSSILSAVIIDYLIMEGVAFFHSSKRSPKSEESIKQIEEPNQVVATSSLPHVCTIYGVILLLTIYSFYLFSPLSYGIYGTPESNVNVTVSNSLNHLKWLNSWEF